MEYKFDTGYVRRGTDSDLWLVEEAKGDHFMADVAETVRHSHEMYVFVVEGRAIGFVVPMRDPDGNWSTGSIYVTPSRRTFSSVKKMMGDFFRRKKAFNFGVDFNRQAA